MNYFEIFKSKVDNKVCFYCNSKNIKEYRPDYGECSASRCLDCKSRFYDDLGGMQFIINISANHIIVYTDEDDLVLEEKNKSSGSNKILCALPKKLLKSFPINFEDIEKYIILL